MDLTFVRTDDDILQDVLDEFSWDPEADPAGVNVQVDDGVVTLTGWVDNYPKKLAAERAAKRIVGVRLVVNDVTVKTAKTRTDTAIAKAAVDALDAMSVLPLGVLAITVQDGVVTLEGEVEWEYQRKAAIDVVHRVEGVQEVVSRISVMQPEVSADEIKSAVERALVRIAELNAANVRIAVEIGHVVLSGTVHTVAEREQAEAAAWRASGVTRVTNQIEVRPDAHLT